MIKKLSKNLGLKVLSVFISILIWIIVNNTINPLVDGIISINVDIMNEDFVYNLNKTYIVNAPKVCKVIYKVNPEKATSIRQSDFKAYIDLTDLGESERGDLPIKYILSQEIDASVANIRIEPKSLNVIIDDSISKAVPVKYNTHGQVDESHSVGNVTFVPNSVIVSGSQKIVDSVSHISIDIPIDNEQESMTGTSIPHIIGIDEKEIISTDIKLSAEEIAYTVFLFTKKVVNIKPNINLNFGPLYSLSLVEINPEQIILEGPKSLLDNYVEIELPEIQSLGSSGEMEYSFPVSSIIPVGTRCTMADEIKMKVKIGNVE